MVTLPEMQGIPPGRRLPTAIGTAELPPNQPPPTGQPAPEWYIVGFRAYTPGNLLLLQKGVLAEDGTLERVAESVVTRNIGPYPPQLLVYEFGPDESKNADSMLDHPLAVFYFPGDAPIQRIVQLSEIEIDIYNGDEARYLHLNPDAILGERKAIPLRPDFSGLESILAEVLR